MRDPPPSPLEGVHEGYGAATELVSLVDVPRRAHARIIRSSKGTGRVPLEQCNMGPIPGLEGKMGLSIASQNSAPPRGDKPTS